MKDLAYLFFSCLLWKPLGHLLVHLGGTSSSPIGEVLGPCGASMKTILGHLGATWASLETNWSYVGPPWATLELPWIPLGPSWVSLKVPRLNVNLPRTMLMPFGDNCYPNLKHFGANNSLRQNHLQPLSPSTLNHKHPNKKRHHRHKAHHTTQR